MTQLFNELDAQWFKAARASADSEPDEITRFLRHVDLDLLRSPAEYHAAIELEPEYEDVLSGTLAHFSTYLRPERLRLLTPAQQNLVGVILKKMDERATHDHFFAPSIMAHLPRRVPQTA